jgi:uncharacterized protein
MREQFEQVSATIGANDLERGTEVPRDFAAALRALEEAVAGREPAWELSAERAARYHREGLATRQDWSRAFQAFQLSSQAYAYAIYDVAWAHYWGLGTPRDPHRAAQVLEDMWARYQVTDCVALAVQYGLGLGVPRDLARHAEWLARVKTEDGTGPQWKQWLAAWNGDRDAQYSVAATIAGKTADSPARMRWLRLAADAGHAQAQFDLAECFRYRHSGASLVAHVLVRYWKGRAAAQGHEQAIQDLAEARHGFP